MDLAALALTMSREQFRARYACLFLCTDLSQARPERPQATAIFDFDNTVTATVNPTSGPPFAAPLIKVQQQFPSMITLGRTQNNDVVVSDTSISKFHAFFRAIEDGGIELADAGSRNGSYVGTHRLVKNQAVRVKAGDRVRFARLSFQLLEPGACWDWLIRAQDQWD
jgi:hypothetical protein